MNAKEFYDKIDEVRTMYSEEISENKVDVKCTRLCGRSFIVFHFADDTHHCICINKE